MTPDSPQPGDVPLEIRRCACGYGTVLQRVYCPRCREPLKTSKTSPRGAVLSWTVLHAVPEDFDAPLGLAIVGLDSGINTMVRFDPKTPVETGDRVLVERRADELRWIIARP